MKTLRIDLATIIGSRPTNSNDVRAKRHKRWTWAPAALMAALFAAPAGAAVSIVNPGFEESATWDGAGWLETVDLPSGSNDPRIIDNSHPFFGATPFGQRYVTLEHPGIGNAVLQYATGFEVGQTYELSFWAAAGFTDSFVQVTGILGERSPGDGLPSFHFDTSYPVPRSQNREFSEWYRFSIAFEAPPDTLTFWIGQSGQGFGPVYFPPIAVDEVSLNVIPEPRAITLTLGGVLLLSRRHRQSRQTKI